MTPRAIVFDLFGVIALTQSPQAQRRIEDVAGVAGVAEERFWNAYWELRPAYDAGRPGVEYWSGVAERLGVRFSGSVIRELVRADAESWCDADDRMTALVAELAASGHRLGLLSNIIEDLIPVFEARHSGWLRHFTCLTYSCRIGVAKPDPRAFEICARRLGVHPADVLFIDDREVNVLAARRAGMAAAIFTSPEQVRGLLTG